MAPTRLFLSFSSPSLTAAVFFLVAGLISGAAPSAAQKSPPASPKAKDSKDSAKKAKADPTQGVTQGALRISGKGGELIECPLLHTDVKADISGFISRVKVTQTFKNPAKEKIEAVYVFPLPHQAAVDQMTMVIGDRRIVGVIKRRDTAREIYEQALQAGQTAALLEQERPNIFTQSVGNIEPGQEINIEISYVDVLNYDQGRYEFHYPMLVGPRFNPQRSPGQPVGDRAGKINPPVLKPNQRNGHDVSLTVNLDAGVKIENLQVANHKTHISRESDSQARVRLLQEDSIPNKDFVLRYDVVGDKPQMAVLAHTGRHSADGGRLGEGYFMLMIQPKEDERLTKSPPREVVFLVDVSGSMRGAPTAKVADAMQKMIKLCRENDTMQVVTFASRANKLFDKPVPINEANKKRALEFASSRRGSGGTHMLQGVKMAIDEPIDKERIRIVVMLTDGYIGNEAQIIQHVGENCGDQIRFWAIGIGQSPNMFLVDGVARQGGGMGKKLGLKDDTVKLTTEVMTRIQRAQLANIEIDWGDLKIAETFPKKMPELWAGRPVIVFGRYKDGGNSEITVRGRVEGEDASWPLTVSLPKQEQEHDVLASVWARQKIEDLMHQSYYAGSPAIEEAVTAIALDYRLMSQYTSFVAVDAKKAKDLVGPARPPRRMMVPVPLPEGTQWEGFFGEGGGVMAGEELAFREGRFGGGVGGGGFAGRTITLTDGVTNWSARPNVRLAMPAKPLTSLGVSQKAPAVRYQKLAQLGKAVQPLRAYNAPSPAPASSATGFSRSSRGRTLTRGESLRRRVLNSSRGVQAGQQSQRSPANRGWAYQPAGRAAGGRVQPARLAATDFYAGDRFYFQRTDALGRFAPAVISPATKVQVQAAKDALAEAKKLQTAKADTAKIHAALARAYMLDTAAVYGGKSNGQIAQQALDALEKNHDRFIEEAAKANPALSKKLSLVLRDQTLEQALKTLSQAAGVAIELSPGSLEDARKLLFDQRMRITYLDLRRATLVQSLDWITQPWRMRWTLKNGKVTVYTARRGDDSAAWIYDVSAIATPTAKELGVKTSDQKNKQTKSPQINQQELIKAAQRHAKEFLTTVRTAMGAGEKSVLWFRPGQLLVLGDAKLHRHVESLLNNLADAKYEPPAKLAKLHGLTIQRVQQRKEGLQKQRKAERQALIAQMLEAYGWPLLAAALDGQLDMQALTELQIAWRDPALKQLIAEGNADLALRSAWIIGQASDALPHETGLGKLAQQTKTQTRAAADKALSALGKKPDNAAAFAQVLYASLMDFGKDYADAARPLLTKSRPSSSPLHRLSQLARFLLDEPTEASRKNLLAFIDAGVQGDDMVVLTALASRLAGEEVWRSFRSKTDKLLGGQPLRGEVVLVVNRLYRTPS